MSIEEAKLTAKFAAILESKAAEWASDYKPNDETLSLSEYAEYGFIKGTQRVLEMLFESKVITPYSLQIILNDYI